MNCIDLFCIVLLMLMMMMMMKMMRRRMGMRMMSMMMTTMKKHGDGADSREGEFLLITICVLRRVCQENCPSILL